MRRRPRVLLVDGDDASLLTMKALLEEEGYRVDTASSAEAAVAAVARSTGEVAYELVVLDRDLGERDALSLAAGVRERLPGARIVLMSGSAEAEDGVGAERAFDAVLAKAASCEVVLRGLREALERDRRGA